MHCTMHSDHVESRQAAQMNVYVTHHLPIITAAAFIAERFKTAARPSYLNAIPSHTASTAQQEERHNAAGGGS